MSEKASTTEPENRPLRFFTICAQNMLPNAIILGRSLRKHHSGSSFTIYLCDKQMEIDFDLVGFPLVRLDQLSIPRIEEMIQRYSITELCTSIKPHCFIRELGFHPDDVLDDLLRRSSSPSEVAGTAVVYLDPDTEVWSPLLEMKNLLDEGSPAVLTPHIVEPSSSPEFTDQHFLRYGIFNSGFLALAKQIEVFYFLHWWEEKLEELCVIDLPAGLFVDQKWVDYLPAFVDHVSVLRHPGYNVAYWNLHERRVKLSDLPTVNGEQLRLVHFSGFDENGSTSISRHSKTWTTNNSFGFGAIVESYRQKLAAAEFEAWKSQKFHFFRNSPRGKNTHRPGVEKEVGTRRENFMFASQYFSFPEYKDFLFRSEGQLSVQRAHEEDQTLRIEEETGIIRSQGFCVICGGTTTFLTTLLYSSSDPETGEPIPNWREHMTCEHCRLQNRVRATIHLFVQELEPEDHSKIYLTEQMTTTYEYLSARFSKLVGSEYLGAEYPLGLTSHAIRNENLEELTFPDNEFDYVVSLDVLEHVGNLDAALAELLRVLSPGGWLVCTAPTSLSSLQGVTRAEIQNDGSVRHILEPEYHGNPVDPENGSLAMRSFGWDILRDLRQTGFSYPFLFHYWSAKFGYLGSEQNVWFAQKPYE